MEVDLYGKGLTPDEMNGIIVEMKEVIVKAMQAYTESKDGKVPLECAFHALLSAYSNVLINNVPLEQRYEFTQPKFDSFIWVLQDQGMLDVPNVK